jgi:DNA-binding XRE family transcriptional regulator
MIKLSPPCTQCPIHLRGLEKSGFVCRTCTARTAYIEALGDDNIMMGRVPPPVLAPPPEAENVHTAADAAGPGRFYSQGPKFTRKTLKRAVESAKNPIGRPSVLRTIMAARRIELGLTQDEVAESAGSTVRTIASLESGCHPYNPKPITLKAIASVLKIGPDQLLKPWRDGK